MNNLRLLWELYQQKRNTHKTREQIALLQKQKPEKLLRYAHKHSPYYRRTFEAAGITADNIAETPLSEFPTLNKELLISFSTPSSIMVGRFWKAPCNIKTDNMRSTLPIWSGSCPIPKHLS